MLKQDYKQLLQQYYDIKRMFELPLKVKLYFSTLESIIDNTNNVDPYKQQVVDHYLIQSFDKQNNYEKATYLLQMIKGIQHYFQKNDGIKQKQQISTESTINNIETSCYIEGFTFKISHWTSCKFKYDKLKRNINIFNSKKNVNLNLQSYLIRKSHKKEFTIVLEAIKKEISVEYLKVSLKFKPDIFTVVYKLLFECVCDILKENVIELTKACLQQNQPNKQSKQNNLQPATSIQKSFTFLTSQQITNYLNYKKKILDRLSVGGFQFKNIYCKQINGEQVRIERSTKIDKIFKLQLIVKKSKEQLKKQFLQSINLKYKYKITSTILEQFSKKYKAVYQKYLINNKIYEQINIKEESNSEKEEIYFSKGLDNIMINNYLQFLIVKVKNTEKEGYNKLIIVASLILSKDITLQVVIAFLEEFRDMLDRQEGDQFKGQMQSNVDQFFTIYQQNYKDQYDYFEEQPPMSFRNQKLAEILTIEAKVTDVNYLSHRFIESPIKLSPQELESRQLKEHYFTGVWGRGKKGGIVLINEQINNQVKKVVYKVIKHLGTNVRKIISSGNFLNHALPMCVFQKASHLEIIGNNFTFAPIFFDRFYQQKDQDPIERLKFVHLFNLSSSNLGIGYATPLNPVLGQTWQGWIGGCPLYMQQVSHHPPISYFNFYGRGYNIYGCIQAKISVGFNNIACYSQRMNVIQFQDGTKIYFLFARMYTTGLLFGQRQFHYVDKTFAFDTKNNIFATMYFGPTKSNKAMPPDYVHGSFQKVFPTYKQKFFQKQPIVFPEKAYIQKQLGTFDGIWNEVIRFDGKQYFDFTKSLPFKMEYEQYPIPSNSTWRKDISFLRQDKQDIAYQNKTIIEQVQRRDKKLRQKYKSNKKKNQNE